MAVILPQIDWMAALSEKRSVAIPRLTNCGTPDLIEVLETQGADVQLYLTDARDDYALPVMLKYTRFAEPERKPTFLSLGKIEVADTLAQF